VEVKTRWSSSSYVWNLWQNRGWFWSDQWSLSCHTWHFSLGWQPEMLENLWWYLQLFILQNCSV